MSVRIAKLVPLGAIAIAAFIAAAPQTASATPYNISNPPTGGGYSVTVVRDGTTSTNVRAGPFQLDDTSDGVGDAFIAWCFDLANTVPVPGNGLNYEKSDYLTTVQRERVQSVFDANYSTTVETTLPDSAAFQLALWDVIYDTDWDIDEATSGSGFKVTATNPNNTSPTILAQAQNFLDAAKTNFNSGGSDKWIITELDGTGAKPDGTNAQGLGFATIPLPAAAWLLLGVSGALVAAKRRTSRKAA